MPVLSASNTPVTCVRFRIGSICAHVYCLFFSLNNADQGNLLCISVCVYRTAMKIHTFHYHTGNSTLVISADNYYILHKFSSSHVRGLT